VCHGRPESLGEWNDPGPADGEWSSRVGVNLGDIFLQADGHVYGDGVNVRHVCRRRRTWSICVSEMVRTAVAKAARRI